MHHFTERSERIPVNVIRELFKLMADPDIISLGGGNPAKESFPLEEVRQITDYLLCVHGADILQYGVTPGYLPLRQAYLEHLARPKGVQAEVANTIIFTGSTQGISLTLELFCNEGDTVLVENPTFLGTLNVMYKMGLRVVPVETDAQGICIDDLEEKVRRERPRLLYTIPTFQNPTGRTIPAERRQRIAELAAKYDFIVLEDDPYGDVRLAGEPVPPIKSFDTAGNVVMMNSFSKIISPGLRVGVGVAEADIAAKLEALKQGADTHTALLPQAICAEFLDRGLLPAHLQRIAAIYRERLDAMLAAMAKHFPADCRYTVPEGGLFLWVELAGDIDATRLLERAVAEEKVAFVPGAPFCVHAEDGRSCMRLNFSNSGPKQITTAIERLGRLLQSETK